MKYRKAYFISLTLQRTHYNVLSTLYWRMRRNISIATKNSKRGTGF